ncbi:OLC1v1001833C1 [Oldenlandia corymbosa var. corymbosa]|uniref:OLC1v1001833C1 n=1 Tax=Oldenlandia corymbosa var. corymbosa TaxID=529605 RepID=A0AAV1D6W9_OLDCO|nr:OLC1v1001833C1 [Oldenlandia corymbosa var. corymbosa]
MPIFRTLPGVHSVDVKFEKNEITVKGAIEAKKIHARLQKWSKKKVEIVSETKVVEKKEEKKDAKKETIKTIQMKVYIHCAECDRNLKRRLLRHKGIHNVKTDIKAQTVTIEGVVEQEKIITYMRTRIRKFAEVIPPKEKKEEKKEDKKEKVEVKVTEKIVEFKEVEKVGVKNKDGDNLYFVHYVYAPQLFSDENPNACSIM